jgi:hypothetical protein
MAVVVEVVQMPQQELAEMQARQTAVMVARELLTPFLAYPLHMQVAAEEGLVQEQSVQELAEVVTAALTAALRL